MSGVRGAACDGTSRLGSRRAPGRPPTQRAAAHAQRSAGAHGAEAQVHPAKQQRQCFGGVAKFWVPVGFAENRQRSFQSMNSG